MGINPRKGRKFDTNTTLAKSPEKTKSHAEGSPNIGDAHASPTTIVVSPVVKRAFGACEVWSGTRVSSPLTSGTPTTTVVVAEAVRLVSNRTAQSIAVRPPTRLRRLRRSPSRARRNQAIGI